MSESVVVHDGIDESKRNWVAITCGAGAVAGIATAVPFITTFAPSERAKAAGAAVEVDISDLKVGEGIEIHDAPETVIASVVIVKEVELEPQVEEGAQPEVVGEAPAEGAPEGEGGGES